MYVCIEMYIYIYREREMYVCIEIYICIYIVGPAPLSCSLGSERRLSGLFAAPTTTTSNNLTISRLLLVGGLFAAPTYY